MGGDNDRGLSGYSRIGLLIADLYSSLSLSVVNSSCGDIVLAGLLFVALWLSFYLE